MYLVCAISALFQTINFNVTEYRVDTSTMKSLICSVYRTLAPAPPGKPGAPAGPVGP